MLVLLVCTIAVLILLLLVSEVLVFVLIVLVHAPPATEDRRGREKSDCGGDLINRAAVLLYSESTPHPR